MSNRGIVSAATASALPRFAFITIFVFAAAILLGDPAALAQDQTTTEPSGTGEVDHHEALQDEPIVVSRELMPRSPSVPVFEGFMESIQVNTDSQGNNIVGDAANEPSMAIDPTDPNNIVIGWRQFDTTSSNFRQAGYAYSHDGGATWTFPGVLQPGQFRSDPVLGANSQGVFFYNSLSSVTTAETFISNDKGVTWSGPFPAFGGDKNWMTIDNSGGIGDRNIYPNWNSQFTCCGFGTDYTRSLDDGLTYQGPFATPEKPKWGTVAVGPDGELYWAGTRISDGSFPVPHLVLKSTSAQDPNQSPVFEQVTGIDLGGETDTGGVPNPGGLMGQVWIDVDRSDGPTRGFVYVLGSVDPPGDDPMDVMFVRSLDGGLTFSPPERVNHDSAANGAWQWFGTMSVAPNGRIDAIWNDTRDDGSALTSAVYYAYSTNAGEKWSDGLKVTPEFNSLLGHPNQNKIGDYYQMISDNVGGALAFSATFNGEQDLYFLRVGDCNANGIHDSEDIIADGTLDCSRNGVIDTCEGFECPPCDFDSQCSDGRFCNGVETCEASLCRPGAPPDCGDGDSCTQDTCNTATDVCENPPVLIPAGTENVNVAKGTPDPDVAVLGWDTVPGADTYNLYRGVQQDLTDQTCLIPGITGTSSPDDGQLPLAGEVFYYGVTSENCAGESTLGDDRVIVVPCP